jgi:enoyl-CoA hydratase/carnithine racemase
MAATYETLAVRRVVVPGTGADGEADAAVLVVALNRPDARNAMNPTYVVRLLALPFAHARARGPP